MTKKELQAELTRLNVEFDPKMKVGELEALVVTAHGAEEGGIPHIVTEEDMTNNPELAEQDVKVGDVVILPKEDEGSGAAGDQSGAGEGSGEAAATGTDASAPQVTTDSFIVVTPVKYGGVRYAVDEAVTIIEPEIASKLLAAGAIRAA